MPDIEDATFALRTNKPSASTSVPPRPSVESADTSSTTATTRSTESTSTQDTSLPTSDNPADSSPIWGSRSPSPSRPSVPASNQEQSDLPALRRQHVTDGYRAGVSAGRDHAETAQMGFDEGYPVGAALGMKTGWVLGCLDELKKRGACDDEVWRSAERDLSVENLVSPGAEGREEVKWQVVDEWITKIAHLGEGANLDLQWKG